ncbi:MAG TPA: hypothetical protein VIA06_07645 [Candidatus Dormibacteraeota bacterium]|jgi:hypothetical protein|nr:hypothetical protein [Candidatus Dormibacteraeota bacterium]
MNSDNERLLELAREIGQRLTGALRGAVPSDAERHLLNAQRELLTALFLIYEHRMGVRREEPQDDGFDAIEDDDDPPERPRRLNRIDVE